MWAITRFSSDEDKEDLCNHLYEVIKEVPATNKVLLLGDFNTRVGWGGYMTS